MKIKICGLTKAEDIEAVNLYRPDYIGFVFAKSRRKVTIQQAVDLKHRLADGISAVGVFMDQTIEEIELVCQSGCIDLIQLHGSESKDMTDELRKLTGKPIIRAISVKQQEDIIRSEKNNADYLLFDQGCGGGTCFDWELLRNAAHSCRLQDKEWFLAGGISLENLDEALAVHPWGIDLSSGVETNGVKDSNKIRELISRVRLYEEER